MTVVAGLVGVPFVSYSIGELRSTNSLLESVTKAPVSQQTLRLELVRTGLSTARLRRVGEQNFFGVGLVRSIISEGIHFTKPLFQGGL